VYFEGDFQELKVPYDASEEVTRVLSDWFSANHGLRDNYLEGSDEARAVLGRLGDHHAAHLDLGGAHFREGALEPAEHHVRRALELGFPAPGLAHNYLALIAHARGDLDGMKAHFMTAARSDPQHQVLIANVEATRRWFAERGPERRLPLELVGRHDFRLFERTNQPTLPGPLAADALEWQAPGSASPDDASLPAESMMRIDSSNESIPFRQKRLPVV
jgi:hypothetical protein